MLRKALRSGGIALIWIALWWGAAAVVGQTLLLPTPWETVKALLDLVRQGPFWLAALHSVYRIVLGFLIGIVLGVLIAILTTRSAWWHDFFSPPLSIMKATPVASFIVLALVWIRTNGVPVFATVLVVLPAVWANVSAGIESIDANLLEMTRAFRMGRWATFRQLSWPSVRPYFHAAVTTTMGMAWKAGVAAEVIATPRSSLGSHLYNAKVYLDTPGLFAVTAVVIALSILLEKLAAWAVRGRGRRDA